MKLFKLVFSFVFLACAIPSKAQIKKVLADKIIATVGDKFILKSDVENAAADYRRQYQGQEGLTPPSNCVIIEGNLIRKALVLQAQKDSLNVTEEEVENAIDSRIRNYIQQFSFSALSKVLQWFF